jgi:L-asparaginase/beta-aspartyl-peptidase (threonine type)
MAERSGGPLVVVHGGAGGSKEDEDGCRAAAAAGMRRFDAGEDALSAVVAAVVVLEDDGRFNAGSGAVLCLDGSTVEMDASIMDTRGNLGAVACIQRVKNPVLVARAVAGTAHWLLAGEGAERYARSAGFPEQLVIGAKARHKHETMLAQLAGEEPAMPGVENSRFARDWNYAQPFPQAAQPKGQGACDTVGAVARDAEGHYAVACSTGGSAPSLLGRVGDTPIIGSGFYAGPEGAVAATGIGEYIVRHLLAHTVYQWIAAGTPIEEALQRGVGLFSSDVDVGLIAVSRHGAASFSNRPMPGAQMGEGGHHGATR